MVDINKLEKLLAQGKITRREFLNRMSALGLAAAISPALMAAPVHAMNPKKGGHFKIAIGDGATSDTLDPRTISTTFMYSLGLALRTTLLQVSPEGELAPELAERWEGSPDAKEWRFYLRKGTEFHNGKSLTAKDVIASINIHRGETKSGVKSLMAQIEELKAEGANTVVMKLKSGNADWPFYMSESSLQIMPAKGDSVDFSGVGCGGYMLENFEPGVSARLKRNPNYWNKNAAYFDSAEMLAILDANARTTALVSGTVHVASHVDFATANRLKEMKGITLHSVPGYRFYSFPMNTTIAPFNDNNVRLALKYAIDREQLLERVFSGHGALGNDHPISPIMRYHADDIPQRTYDPDRAKHYLKKAGLDKLEINLSASDGAWIGAVNAAVLYKEDAKKSGITINVVREPKDGYWSNVWMKKPFCAAKWSGRMTEDWMFTLEFMGGGNWNDAYWSNARFDKILVEARTVMDSKKRAEMYREMQLMVRDEGGVIIPFFPKLLFAARDNVGIPKKISGTREVDGNRWAVRWWLT